MTDSLNVPNCLPCTDSYSTFSLFYRLTSLPNVVPLPTVLPYQLFSLSAGFHINYSTYRLSSLLTALPTDCRHYRLFSLPTVLITDCPPYLLSSLPTVLSTNCPPYQLPFLSTVFYPSLPIVFPTNSRF